MLIQRIRALSWSFPVVGLAAALLAGTAAAKLPPLDDAAKAKAAEAAAKTAHTGKLEAFLLCKSMDKVAAEYFAEAKQDKRSVSPPVATPPCVDPGPFVYTPPETRPLEASGAHSPPETAKSPPSTTVPAAVATPAPTKK